MTNTTIFREKWIPIPTFCEIAGVTENTVYVSKNSGVYPQHVFKPIPKYQNRYYINIDYFERRLKFQKRIMNKLHCYYYVLNRYFSDTTLASLVCRVYDRTEATVRNALGVDIWSLKEPKLAGNTILTPLFWQIFRVFRHILRHIFRLKCLKLSEVDLMKLHDLGGR